MNYKSRVHRLEAKISQTEKMPLRLLYGGEHGKPSHGVFNIEHLNLCRQDALEYIEDVAVAIFGTSKDFDLLDDLDRKISDG